MSAREVPSVSLGDRLEALFAGDPVLLADPYSLYAEVREQSRAYELGPMIVLTHYEDVKWAVRDAQALSNRGLIEGSRVDAARAKLDAEALEAFDELTAFGANFVSRMDGDDHARMRTIAHRAFTPGRIAELEIGMRRRVDELLERLVNQDSPDLMMLAYRLPLAVVADLLGVPEQDTDMIHEWSLALGAANASMEAEPVMRARDALREFLAYVDEMIARYRAAPGSTQLVELLMGADRQDRISDFELAAVCVQFLFAGHETTTNLIGAGMLALLRHPDEWAMLTDDPSRTRAAVDEIVRFVSPAQFVSRLALRDLEVGDVRIAAGTTVVPVLAAANRDPGVFPDPDRLRLDRPESRNHLGFGFGAHFCLGAALARLEADVAISALARRCPDLGLVEDDVEWGGGAMLRRLERLPVRLG